jgi:hypothetical protein
MARIRNLEIDGKSSRKVGAEHCAMATAYRKPLIYCRGTLLFDGCSRRSEGAEWCRPPHRAVQLISLRVTDDAYVDRTKLRMENLEDLYQS